MSKIAAIDVAVRHQLSSDNKGAADYSKLMGTAPATTTGTPPASYDYDKNGMKLFLLNVANRLRLDTPAFQFDWRSLDPDSCLESTLVVLISQIECATKLLGSSS